MSLNRDLGNCADCEAPLAEMDGLVCRDCVTRRLTGPLCLDCDKPLGGPDDGRWLCAKCKAQPIEREGLTEVI